MEKKSYPLTVFLFDVPSTDQVLDGSAEKLKIFSRKITGRDSELQEGFYVYNNGSVLKKNIDQIIPIPGGTRYKLVIMSQEQSDIGTACRFIESYVGAKLLQRANALSDTAYKLANWLQRKEDVNEYLKDEE